MHTHTVHKSKVQTCSQDRQCQDQDQDQDRKWQYEKNAHSSRKNYFYQKLQRH